jgi:hypothetical protein
VHENSVYSNGLLLISQNIFASARNIRQFNGLAKSHFSDCKTFYPGSIPGVASTCNIKDLTLVAERTAGRPARAFRDRSKRPRHYLFIFLLGRCSKIAEAGMRGRGLINAALRVGLSAATVHDLGTVARI